MDSGKNIVYGGAGNTNMDLKKSLMTKDVNLDKIINEINETDNNFMDDLFEKDYNSKSKAIMTESGRISPNKSIKTKSYSTNKSNKFQEQNKNKNDFKINKLDGISSPYERLQILNQLEEENRKRTQLLLEKIAKGNS